MRGLVEVCCGLAHVCEAVGVYAGRRFLVLCPRCGSSPSLFLFFASLCGLLGPSPDFGLPASQRSCWVPLLVPCSRGISALPPSLCAAALCGRLLPTLCGPVGQAAFCWYGSFFLVCSFASQVSAAVTAPFRPPSHSSRPAVFFPILWFFAFSRCSWVGLGWLFSSTVPASLSSGHSYIPSHD